MNGAFALYYLNLNFQAPWPLFKDLANNIKIKFSINLGLEIVEGDEKW